jgi:hypothetical protein
MGRVIFLVEDQTMQELLDTLLPRLFPSWRAGEHFLCIKHEGKSDLEKSIPRKLRAWAEPNARFVVLRDNDGADCILVKKKLRKLCADAGRADTLVRIACQEVEAWYLGDLPAMSKAFGSNINTQPNKKRFNDPDRLSLPSAEVKGLIPSFQKTAGARLMAHYLSEASNSSESFQQFVSGVRRFADATN